MRGRAGGGIRVAALRGVDGRVDENLISCERPRYNIIAGHYRRLAVSSENAEFW